MEIITAEFVKSAKVPADYPTYPSRQQVIDYLEAYTRHFQLDARCNCRVTAVRYTDQTWQADTSEGMYEARYLVVATGLNNRPHQPAWPNQERYTGQILHSAAYRNGEPFRGKPVLVVGFGNSGAEIAVELAPHHHTWLSGRDTGQEPTRAGSVPDRLFTPIMWLIATRLTVKTRLGRKLRDQFLNPPRGIPLGRVRRKDFGPAGIERVPRMTGVMNGRPVLEDGRRLEVSNVIWCTGFTPDYDWIDLSLPTRNGVPDHNRGVVESCPGLYFVGLPFLYSLSSALLGGVGRDAEHIVEHLAATRSARVG